MKTSFWFLLLGSDLCRPCVGGWFMFYYTRFVSLCKTKILFFFRKVNQTIFQRCELMIIFPQSSRKLLCDLSFQSDKSPARFMNLFWFCPHFHSKTVNCHKIQAWAGTVIFRSFPTRQLVFFKRIQLFLFRVISAKKQCVKLGISAIYSSINEISIAGAFRMLYNVTNRDQQ